MISDEVCSWRRNILLRLCKGNTQGQGSCDGGSSTQGCSGANVNRQPGNPKISRLASRHIGTVQLMSVVGILTSTFKKVGNS